MSFIPEVKRARALERKQALPAFAIQRQAVGKPYRDDWDIDRADRDALRKVIWVFRSIHAIADAQARLPFEIRQDSEEGEPIEDHFLIPLLNQKPNADESAYSFRYRLSAQVLISRKGAFAEMTSDRFGNVVELRLLDPRKTHPVPGITKDAQGRTRLVKRFDVDLGEGQTEEIAPEKVLWFRLPHPIDPLGGLTPLEAAGISIDIDILGRLYNRTFLQNDGRPGGIVGVRGDMDEDVADELEDRFNRGIGGAGRVTVLEADGLDFVDTAVTPRDAQYTQSRTQTKEDLLGAFGVPESIALGNASQRTYDNVDAERYIFWDPTMLGHLALLGDGFNQADQDPSTFAHFNTDGVDVLQRAKEARHSAMREEVKDGVRTLDSYLEETGRKPTDSPEGRSYWMPMGMVPIATDDGSAVPSSTVQAVAAAAAKKAIEDFEGSVVTPFRYRPQRGRREA